MKIALNAWFLDQPGTGSGQSIHGLLRAMPTVGSDHELLLVLPQGQITLEIPGLQVELWPFPSRTWRTDLGKVLFEQVAFPWACRRWGADVAHVPYWGSPLWPPVPTLVTVHDLIPLLLPAYRGGPLVRLYSRMVSASARRAAGVLTDSLASKCDIEEHLGVHPERVRCIYLAPGDHFSPEVGSEDEAIRQSYGLPSRYVLYLAGHDVRKNVAGLVEAFATVARADADVKLVIGGRLPTRSGRRLTLLGRSPLFDPRPLVEGLGLTNDVHFIGWVEEAHKPALYRGAACAVFPSRYEGFGLPVLEALACGTPLVTSNTSSLPEILGDAGFAVDPDDVDGLAGAVLACLVDESLAADLRRRGPVQAARFSWSRALRETLEAYEAVQQGQPIAEGAECVS
jgi:glycosyltransferase involved in cell wall biosynthesis